MATSRSGSSGSSGSSSRASGASPSNLTKNLKGIDFPAEKEDLFKHAKQHHADKIVLDEIQKMDERQYSSMADVMKSFEPSEGKGKSRSSSSTSSSSGSKSRSSSGESKSSSGSSSSHGRSHK